MCELMNSNDYTHDPLSLGDPCNQISARCDLPRVNLTRSSSSTQPPHPFPLLSPPPNGPFAFGGIDSKNVDMVSAAQQRVRTISGMPYEHVPPFAFTPQWSGVAHRGMPHEFKFNWTTMAPARGPFSFN